MIEPLEHRIAPAALVGNVLKYTDIDGDLVKITFSHATMAAGDFDFSTGPGLSGDTKTQEALTSLSMTGHSGGGFTLTAKQQNGQGDGRANIGTITSNATSLGSISIDGDLSIGSFTSSSAILPAIKSLSAYSLGADVTTSNAKIEFQGIGSLTVKSDISNVQVLLDASAITTKSITVGGDLIGGNFVGSGNLTANAPVTAVKIGGSVIGGIVTSAGQLELKSTGLHSVTIGGSILGGAITDNGRLDIPTGDPATVIKIGGDVTGIVTFGIAKSLTVVGSVVGSSTSGTGLIIGNQSLGTLALGSIIGGNSPTNGPVTGSGSVKVAGNLSSLKVTGGIYAGRPVGQNGTVSNDGILAVNGTVGTATIGTIQGNAGHAAYFSVSGSVGNLDAVKTLTVTHSVSYGSILAGFGSNLATATDSDAGFGSIVIGGNLSASYITAGANSGADGVAGNADDTNASTTATIGSVKIAGEFNGVAGSNTYYEIFAGKISKAQVGAAVYIHPAQGNLNVNFDAIGLALLLSQV